MSRSIKALKDFRESCILPWREKYYRDVEEYIYSSACHSTVEESFEHLFSQAAMQQKNGEKRPAAYVAHSFLYTALAQKKLCFRLDVYDQSFYSDKTETSVCWELEGPVQTLFTAYESSLARIPRYVGAFTHHLAYSVWLFEVFDIRKACEASISFVAQNVLSLDSYRDMDKFFDVKFYMGDYMGTIRQYHQVRWYQ